MFLLVAAQPFSDALAAPNTDKAPPRAACTGWQGISTLILQGVTEAGGLKGQFSETRDTRNGRFVAGRNYTVFSTGEGFDGHDAWSKDRSGFAHDLNSAPAKAIAVSQAWLRRRAWCDEIGSGERIERLAEDGSPAAWRVDVKGGIPIILRFDRGGLLAESEVRLMYSREVRRYSDWRDIGGGIKVPFAVRTDRVEDETTETISLTSAEDTRFPKLNGFYAKPAPPRDYGILGKEGTTHVAYEDDGVGRIFVPVMIDGHGPFPFEVDTGSDFVMTAETAAALHLNGAGSVNTTGGGTDVIQQSTVPTAWERAWRPAWLGLAPALAVHIMKR